VRAEGIGVCLPPDPEDTLRLREPVLEHLFSGMSSGMGLSVLFNVASVGDIWLLEDDTDPR
jgi:hypothetical protein